MNTMGGSDVTLADAGQIRRCRHGWRRSHLLRALACETCSEDCARGVKFTSHLYFFTSIFRLLLYRTQH